MSVEYPVNPLTRILDETSRQNSNMRGGVASATPLPTAQSAVLGRLVDEKPLTTEEREELDRLAVAAGVRDERLSTTEVNGPYATMEEAIAAGGPVIPDVATSGFVKAPPVGTRTPSAGTRLPNFQLIESIDLRIPAIIVDGMLFPINDALARELRYKAIETVGQILMDQWATARDTFASPSTVEDTNGGTGSEGMVQAVQRIPEGSSEESPE